MQKSRTKFKQTEIGMIPEDWEVRKVGEFVDIKHGYAFKGEFFTDIPNGNILLTPGNFKIGGGFKKDKLKYTIEESPIDYVLKEDDVVVTMTDLSKEGDTLGYSAKVPASKGEKYLHNQRIGLLKFKSKEISLDFMYWVLRTKKYNFFVVGSATGSTVKHTSPDRIKQFIFGMPINVNEQSAIAKILSDLDSKIELNQQMNKILESIGQAIFKHWFVDFEFPNEKGKPYKSSGGKMIDSELGKIPKEFRVSKIGNEFETVLGGTPSTTNKFYWENGTIPWINSGKVNEFRITAPTAYISKESVDNSATKLMPKGTTVLAITGATLGQVSRIEIDTCANQSVIGIIENKDIPSEYVYLWIKHKIIGLISHQTGGAQQHINKNNVNELEILLPADALMLKFKEVTRPIFKNISINCFESQNLSQIRDSLIPKLMSGQILVPVWA